MLGYVDVFYGYLKDLSYEKLINLINEITKYYTIFDYMDFFNKIFLSEIDVNDCRYKMHISLGLDSGSSNSVFKISYGSLYSFSFIIKYIFDNDYINIKLINIKIKKLKF